MFLSIVLTAGLATAGLIATDPQPRPRTEPVLNKQLLLQLVNEARKKGCQCGDTWYPAAPPLQWNDQLEKAALAHSQDMNAHNYFSHTSRSGSKAGERIAAAGYRWRAYGENIAEGFSNEREVVAGWLKSPGHCRNLLNRMFAEMGVARVGKYWTQKFGARL